ncbi:hypothetical protein BpHYR1_016960 [Brachionus plicatilis]|uniref:Uncharacterized protein n=1 Tax=Brachionus plicatilis TaxID=10195 RepID=A0A3M7SS74_BRAPC|nr:hypothetical protein BpHYR1_016960 [Brachionus plicatilis]
MESHCILGMMLAQILLMRIENNQSFSSNWELLYTKRAGPLFIFIVFIYLTTKWIAVQYWLKMSCKWRNFKAKIRHCKVLNCSLA